MSKLPALPHIFRQLHLHLVFAIKNPKNFLPQPHLEKIERYLTGIIQNKLSSKVIYIKCLSDHLHLFIDWRLHQTLSELVSKTKTRATTYIKGQGWGLIDFAWQNGYGAFSYSFNQVHPFIAYLKNQEAYHQHHSFKTEYLTILDKFEVAYQLEYLFDFYEKEKNATLVVQNGIPSKKYRPRTYTKLYLHLVLVVKGRDYGIPKSYKAALHAHIAQLIEKEGHELFEIHCMPDHTHLLLVFRPSKNLIELVDAIKRESQSFIQVQLGCALNWQDGFGVFSCSPSHISNLEHYIQHQEEHHRQCTFREEYLNMLSELEEEVDVEWVEFYDVIG